MDKVIIYEPDNSQPVRTQEIEIVYNFVGVIKLVALDGLSEI